MQPSACGSHAYQHASYVIAEVTTDTPAMLTLQEKYNWDVNDVIPVNLQSSLIYQDVFPGIDLQYTTYGYNIKEQIIVNEPQESYRFDFLLESDGLNAVLNENGSVSFLNADQEEVYQIPTPCMEDALGLGSFDVHFVLNETEQGTVLTVEADEEWINSEDREFPVKIDPTLVVISGNALVSFLLTLVLAISLATPAFAAEDSLVQPRFKHIISFGTSITYGDWGIATCSSSVIIDSGYKVTLVLTLQRSSGNDSWEDVETWSAAGNAGATISERRALYSQYSYRVKSTATVYDLDGNWIESESQIDY